VDTLSQSDEEYHFSSKFERKMNRVIKNERLSPELRKIKSHLKKMVAVFCVIVFSGFVLSMSVKANRVRFYNFIRMIFEDSVLYQYFVGADLVIEYVEPTYIPNEYVISDSGKDEISQFIIYKSNGKEIIFDQVLINDGYNLLLDVEYDFCEKVQIGKTEGYMIKKYGEYSKVLFEYGVSQIIITGFNINDNELIKIAESVQ
ncbi:MAG: DUF4367 domain-containing protein, partial [Anaeroplasmataceae bacterium]|nr:DUF4367 domain-containing protein [Anaeroplasmataceae bacterium]